jgi:hypothetical protein
MVVFFALVGFVIAVFALTVLVGAPYVPSHRRELEGLFSELYPLAPQDAIVDIGSGDGIVLAVAAERGARAIGYEINPFLVGISRLRLRKFGRRAQVHLANFWQVSLPAETTLVYTFGESRDIKKMYKKVQHEATRLQKPLVFISYGFRVPGQTETRSLRAHHVYEITPLQPGEA